MILEQTDATGATSRYVHAELLGGIDAVHIVYDRRAVPRRLHEAYFIGVAEGGPHHLWARGRTWRVTDGMIVALHPRDVHGTEQIGYAAWGYRGMFLSAEQLIGDQVGSAATPPPRFRVPTFEDGEISDALRELHPHLMSDTAHRDRAEHTLRSTLDGLLARHASNPSLHGAAEHWAVARALDYMHAHYGRPIRVPDLAAHVRLSPYHLIRVFHAAVGIPPYTYLDQLRVANARLLLASGCSISEAAYRTGFSDQSHLTRHFKRALGMTPGAYCRCRRPGNRAA